MFKNLSIYEQLVALPYLNTYKQLVEAAIELNLFSHLEKPITSDELSFKMGWNNYNTFNLLKGLYSIGYVKRDGDKFSNMEETSKYLVKDKPQYMGDVLKFFCNNQGLNLGDVVLQVKEGPKPMEQTMQTMDFSSYGDAMRDAQSGIRQQELLDIIRSLPENKSINKILDLGCGAGCLGLSVIKDEPDRTGVLFDLPCMHNLIEETVSLANMREKVVVMSGDFIKDDIGDGYDLIICSSIMLFLIVEGESFFSKLKSALNPNGVVICLNEGIEPDYSGPWDMVLGYLTFNFQGIPMGVIKGQVKNAAQAGGFDSIENRTVLLSTGTHDINILRKTK